jgi:hypothetical protein
MKRFPGFCAVVMLVVCTSAVAGYVQITPSDDSYILTSSPTVNYGAKTTLVVQGPGATTFVRFDLSSLPSGLTSSSLSEATLKVYVSAATSAGTFDVDRVTARGRKRPSPPRPSPRWEPRLPARFRSPPPTRISICWWT